MEEKILKELENINVQMNQRFEDTKNEIVTTLRDEFDKKLETTEDKIVTKLTDEFDKKLETTEDKIVTKLTDEFDKKLETTEDKIVTTLRGELDERLTITEKKISDDVSDNIKSLCDSITRVEDKKHNEIITLLKIHEKREAQRMEAIRQAFVD